MELHGRDHEERPWGEFERFTHNELTTVKLIRMNKHSKISYQYHEKRTEFWRVLSGQGFAVIDGENIPVSKGSEVQIPQGTKHRMITEDSEIEWMEISFGTFDEEDNIRLEDEYGRS